MIMYETARGYEAMGLFPVPAQVEKNTCDVIAKWQNEPQNVDGWKRYFSTQNGIGIKLGVASKNLQVIDVDQKHDSTASLSARFMEAIKYMLPDVYDDFYIEETRSGGLHVFFHRNVEIENKFVPAKTLEFSQKLGKEHEVALIEALGEGNMVFTYPTPNYRILQGSIEEIPTINETQYRELIAVCQSFNELPIYSVEETCHNYPRDLTSGDDDQRTGSIFNRKVEPKHFAGMMVQNGWTVVKNVGEKYWLRRPDKKEGVSATFNHDGRKLLCVFTTSTEFETNYKDKDGAQKQKGYTPFAVLTKLKFNGDYKAAAKHLVDKGFVNPHEWPEVEPLEPIKAKSFDLDVIMPEGCEKLKTYISEVANSFQVRPEMVLLPAISAASLAICGCATIQISQDWREDSPVWSIVVAEASERKSPVLKEIMRPFDTYFKDFGKRHKSAIKSLVRRRAAVVAKIEKLEEDYSKAVGKNESVGSIESSLVITEAELESMPEIVDLPNLMQSDATPEALVKQLKKNGEVCGVISAEADPIEVALGLYSDKPNFSIYLKGYSVERYNHNRVGGGETVIEQPRIVLSVMMQREPMEKLSISRVARSRGFLGRCFYAVPTSLVGHRILEPAPVSNDAREWWSDRIESILSLPHRLRLYDKGGELQFYKEEPFSIKMSEQAREIFLDARKKNESELVSGGEFDDEGGWGGKLMGNICRLALSLHFLSGRGLRDEVNLPTMKAAIAWIPFLTEHYYCATGEVGEISIDKIVHSVIRKMMAKEIKTGVSLRDLFDLVRNNRRPKADDWKPVWARMLELGFIRIKDGEKPIKGAAKKVVELHPNFYGLAK